jgi:hypothetical protein
MEEEDAPQHMRAYFGLNLQKEVQQFQQQFEALDDYIGQNVAQ